MSFQKKFNKKYSFDLAEIFVKGGKGGDGIIAFRREKYVPYGGPSGGDGGKGGDVILKVNPQLDTLTKFRFKKVFKAEDGRHGEGNNKTGKDGEDLIIDVPPGVLVWDKETGELLGELTEPGEELVVARGGEGGKGNASFATPENRAPRIRTLGEEGEERRLILELRIIAEGGLVGYPNVGKSTILSKISNAKPKIASYPFTTLTPVIGEVRIDDKKSLRIVDLPGLIDGAHEGKGLGLTFLRHIQRTYFLIFVFDVSETSPMDAITQYKNLVKEIEEFNPEILEKDKIIVLNKIDLPVKNLEETENYFYKLGFPVVKMSAIKGEGVSELKKEIGKIKLPEKEKTLRPKRRYVLRVDKDKRKIEVKRIGETFYVYGEELGRLIKGVDLTSPFGIERVQKIFKRFGVEEELKKLGVKEGDLVIIEGIRFRYHE